MPILISDDQIAEAREWEKRCLLGQCSLEMAMSMIMLIGAPIPPRLMGRFERAFNDYRAGKFTDLASPFGAEMQQRAKQHMQTLLRDSALQNAVDDAAKRGFPKTDPGAFDGTAFHAVAERWDLSPSSIHTILKRRRKQKAEG